MSSNTFHKRRRPSHRHRPNFHSSGGLSSGSAPFPSLADNGSQTDFQNERYHERSPPRDGRPTRRPSPSRVRRTASSSSQSHSYGAGGYRLHDNSTKRLSSSSSYSDFRNARQNNEGRGDSSNSSGVHRDVFEDRRPDDLDWTKPSNEKPYQSSHGSNKRHEAGYHDNSFEHSGTYRLEDRTRINQLSPNGNNHQSQSSQHNIPLRSRFFDFPESTSSNHPRSRASLNGKKKSIQIAPLSSSRQGNGNGKSTIKSGGGTGSGTNIYKATSSKYAVPEYSDERPGDFDTFMEARRPDERRHSDDRNNSSDTNSHTNHSHPSQQQHYHHSQNYVQDDVDRISHEQGEGRQLSSSTSSPPPPPPSLPSRIAVSDDNVNGSGYYKQYDRKKESARGNSYSSLHGDSSHSDPPNKRRRTRFGPDIVKGPTYGDESHTEQNTSSLPFERRVEPDASKLSSDQRDQRISGFKKTFFKIPKARDSQRLFPGRNQNQQQSQQHKHQQQTQHKQQQNRKQQEQELQDDESQDVIVSSEVHRPEPSEVDSLSQSKSSRSVIPKSKLRTEDMNGSVYERISQVGEGTYGKVYKALNTITNKMVALKRIRMESERDGFPITALREIKLLQSVRHENVVSLLEIMVEKSSVYMIFEYMDHDLSGILTHPTFKLGHGHIKDLFRQMLEGLAYLHKRGVLHRDIKGSNILLSNSGLLKIADFGLARFYHKHMTTADYTNRVITLWYRPPELLLGATAYGPSVDVWGVGCLMLEMYTSKAIFQGQDEIQQLESIYSIMGSPTKENWPDVEKLPWYELVRPSEVKPSKFKERFENLVPPHGLTLASNLLALDPSKRPSAADALKSEYFTKELPRPERPTGLGKLGEWHEYESKLRRKNEKKQQQQRERQEVMTTEPH
ncbi:kinase-like domain-containing protein [Dipodascopsis uninucleata]